MGFNTALNLIGKFGIRTLDDFHEMMELLEIEYEDVTIEQGRITMDLKYPWQSPRYTHDLVSPFLPYSVRLVVTRPYFRDWLRSLFKRCKVKAT